MIWLISVALGLPDYRWEGVECLPYKEDGRALFKSVSRQVLFSDADLAGDLRYFEVRDRRHFRRSLRARARGDQKPRRR